MEAVLGVSPVDSSSLAKRSAARIGPMVWELDGPMPILNSSKRLCFTSWPSFLLHYNLNSNFVGDGNVCVTITDCWVGGTKKRQQRDIQAAVANWQDYKRRK